MCIYLVGGWTDLILSPSRHVLSLYISSWLTDTYSHLIRKFVMKLQLFLRGNPNLTLQMRPMNAQRPYVPSAVSTDALDALAPPASLQVPSLLSSASSGSMADKRKIGQTVSRDSAASCGGSPSTSKRGRFATMPVQHQHQQQPMFPPPQNGMMGQMFVGAGAIQMAPPSSAPMFASYNPSFAFAGAQGVHLRKVSDAHLLQQQPGAPTPGAVFRGAVAGGIAGGRVSMRGRSRGVAVPMTSLQMAQRPALDRRDEMEHRAPAPAATRANFPVSSRGRAGGKGPVRAPIRDTSGHGSEAVDAMMMMKGVSSVPTGAPPAPAGEK